MEKAYVEAQIEKYKAIKVAYPKPLKVFRNKMVGRKIITQISPISGIPIELVGDKGKKVKVFMTNEYTRLLQFYFKHFHGFESRRISSEGRWRPDKTSVKGGRFIKGMNNGIEDIQVYLPNGVMLAVEVKGPNDRQRPEQAERQRQLGRAYMIATSDFEAFQRLFLERLKEFLK